MLTITFGATDILPEVTIRLEHSLVTMSKWEATQEKPFFGKEDKTHDETVAYIQDMLLDESPFPDWTSLLKAEHYEGISEYINSKQSATWFREDSARPSRETVTSELIYYWMIQFGIPFDPCERWHVNRLMTLIKICGLKQAKPKKMTQQQQAEEYRRLNAQRRQQLQTSG